MVRAIAWALLVAITAWGGALRFRAAGAAYERPTHGGDEGSYFGLGRRLARCDGSYSTLPTGQGSEAFRALLYPGFIAAVARAWPPLVPGKVRLVQAALSTLMLPLVFFLGARIHSSAAGLAAAVLLAVQPMAVEPAAVVNIHCFFAFLVLIVAFRLVAWGDDQSPANSLWLGLAIGLSLSCRSTLFALPIALGVWVAARRERWRLKTRTAAFILMGAAAPLLPWVLRNACSIREFIPFERHAVALNLFLASQGMIDEDDGEEEIRARAKSEIPDLASVGGDSQETLRRVAIRTIADQPWAYVLSTLRRVVRLAGYFRNWFNPILLTAMILGALSPGAGPLLGLMGYWLAAHATMSVTSRYLTEMVPVACVLAGIGLARGARWATRAGDVPAWREALRPVRLGRAPVLASTLMAAAVYVASLVFLAGDLYASYDIAGNQRTCQALNLRGQHRFFNGDLSGALSEFSKAVDQCPRLPQFRQNRGVALALMGRDKEAILDYDETERLLMADDDFGCFYWAMLSSRAESYRKLGQRSRYERDLNESLSLTREHCRPNIFPKSAYAKAGRG